MTTQMVEIARCQVLALARSMELHEEAGATIPETHRGKLCELALRVAAFDRGMTVSQIVTEATSQPPGAIAETQNGSGVISQATRAEMGVSGVHR